MKTEQRTLKLKSSSQRGKKNKVDTGKKKDVFNTIKINREVKPEKCQLYSAIRRFGVASYSHSKEVLGTEPDHTMFRNDWKVKKWNRNSYISSVQLHTESRAQTMGYSGDSQQRAP